MADQHSDNGVGKANAAIESLDSKGVTDRPSDKHVSTTNVSVGSSESQAVANQDANVGMSIADFAPENLKTKDAADKHLDEGLSTDHEAVTSSESSGVTDQHLDESLSVADVALESLKSKDVADKKIDEGAITDHLAGTSAKSASVTDQHLDESVSVADVAIESLKSKDVADKIIDEGAITDHVAGRSAKSTSVTDQHLDESVSVADVALESLKSKDVADKIIDEGAITDHVAGTSAKSTSVTDQHSGEGVSLADVKGVADKSIGEGAITNHVADTSAKSTSVTDQHSDEGLSIADVSLDSLKSKGVADKHLDEGAVTDHVKSSQLTDVATQHSDEGVSLAQVSHESLKPKGVVDKDLGKGETKTNVNTENSESKGSGSTIKINVKTLDSHLHNFEVDKNMLVSVFKEKIASKVDLPVEKQRLIFRGKVLKDEDHLFEYHIESGHTLHLVARQPSEFQNSAGSPNADATARSISTVPGQYSNVTGTHPFVGHVSHSVVLGTIGAGPQDETNNPDIGQVIGGVLNSFGIAAQAPMGAIGATQPNMQFSIPVQVAHRSETGASFDNHGQTRDQSQPMPQATPAPVPTRAMPIPDSLYTISEYMNRMERALSPNGYQPSNSTEGVPAPAELPTNARGLLSPAALAVVLRHAQRLLIGPTIDSLSHTARRLEEEVGCTDVNVRTEIHTEAMQSGLAMQHLGALLLELGRTMLTLRIGQSHVESSVNAGPAVYISSSGPNPIMTQPFPLQTNSLFGDHHATPTMNPMTFNPMGVGSVPRHLNIHIHAGVGPRATNVESNQGELTNRNAGVNSQTREVGDNTISGNQDFSGLPEVQTDAGGMGNATSSTTRMKSLSEADGGSSSSRRSNAPIPVGLGSEGLQPQRRPRQTRSEACGSGTSNSYGNQSLTYPGGQMDPATMMNQVMQNPALSGLIAGASNQSGAGPPDVLRNLMSQLAQNPAMMNTVNQLAQQMDGNQDLASMMAGMGGPGDGNGDMSSMVQQMMPFVSQALNRGSSSSNLLQRQPSRKPTLHRRHSSVKNLNINERSSSDFQMNLENAAQKIVEQYPPIEIFSSIVETAALNNNIFDSGALDELCMEEELAQEFVEMLKGDISRRLQGRR